MAKVFLSSVSRDLTEVRRKIIEILRTAGFDVLNMENFGARPENSLAVCLQELRLADVAVVTLGPHYGSINPESGISYTHEEFREASRRGIPVLAFRIPDAADLNQQQKEGLAKFRAEVGAALTYKETNQADLPGEVVASLRAADQRGELLPKYGIFQPYQGFFRLQLSAAPLFNHTGPFIGRADELAQLRAFATSASKVCILSAPGGTGKSRLLLEFAKAMEPGQKVLFVDAGAQWTAEDIKRLPVTPATIIVDDAHRRPDLDRLMQACLGHNPNAKFIVSCRPSALPIVEQHLTGLYAASSTPTITLAPLPAADALQLAQGVLGTDLAHLAPDLVRISDNNPLIISVGGRCIVVNRISATLLSKSPQEFRIAALDKLLEGSVSASQQKFLTLLAGIGPVVLEGTDLPERIGQFLGIQPFEVVSIAAELERAGLLQRRGRMVRVSPDVLADHLLYRASVANGVATGFVDSIIDRFGSSLLANILANAAELDWRGAPSGDESVLAKTWRALKAGLPGRTHSQRTELVGQMHRAAVFAPRQVLELVEWLCDHSDAPKDDQLAEWGFEDTPNRLNAALCDMLAFLATEPSLTSRCLARLWQFAADDESPVEPSAIHPRRKIEDLLKYSKTPHRDAVQQTVIDFLSSKLDDTGRTNEVGWAVGALGKVLNREADWTSAKGAAITLSSAALYPYLPQIGERRRKVVDQLIRRAMGQRLTEAAVAVHELGRLLEPPRGTLARKIEKAEMDAWLPEATAAATAIAGIAGTAPLEIIRYLARRELREQRTAHWPDMAKPIADLLATVKPEPSEALFDVFLGRPWEEQDDDYQKEEAELRKQCAEIAQNFWATTSDPTKVLDGLLRSLSELRVVRQTESGNDGELLRALAAAKPEAATGLIDALATASDSNAVWLIRAVLFGVKEKRGKAEALALVHRFQKHPSANARAVLARSLEILIDGDPTELDLLNPFLGDDDDGVRRAAIQPLRKFSTTSPTAALAEAVKTNWDEAGTVALAVFDLLDKKYGIDPDQLTDSQIDTLLGRLKPLARLDERRPDTLQFIAYASGRRPQATLDMLLHRIAATDRERPKGEHAPVPIPHSGENLALPGLATNNAQYLRQIRDAMLPAGLLGRLWLPTLFGACALSPAAAVPVLREWVTSGDVKKLEAAAVLLKGFDHEIVFTEHAFIAGLLEAAAQKGADCLEAVEGSLFGVAIGGVRSGGAGQPSPRLVQDKKSAEELVKLYQTNPAAQKFYETLVKYAKDSMKRDADDWAELEQE